MLLFRPTFSASYLEIGSSPVSPMRDLAFNQMSSLLHECPPMNLASCNMSVLLSLLSGNVFGLFFIFSRFLASFSVSFFEDFPLASNLLSSLMSSVHDRVLKVSSGWWFKLGKSALILSISDFVLSLYLCLGMENFAFVCGLCGVSLSEDELSSLSVDEHEESEGEVISVLVSGVVLLLVPVEM